MKKVTLEITYDDSKGYKGHGDNTPELIKTVVENELRAGLESDGVIKSDWKVVVVEAESDDLDSWEEM
jgi:hypothetical protein